jgi:hypothetical protein
MPSRVAGVAKIVVCVTGTTNSASRPRTTVSSRPVVTQPQNRQLHAPTQTTLLSTPKPAAAAASRTVSVSLSSLLYRPFYLSHRHQRHHQHRLTKMDAALAKIFVSNAQWVKAVNSAEPDFFEQSAKGQSPKVRLRPLFFHHVASRKWEEILSFLLRCISCSLLPFVYIPTDPLAWMLRLSRPRKCRDCLTSRRYLRSPQHCEPSSSGRR